MTAADAIALVPLQVWSRVLATLLKILPGRSPFAFCSDFGDAPPLALHAVLDRPIESLQGLLRLTRSMHVMDWTQNREIAGVVAGWMQTV